MEKFKKFTEKLDCRIIPVTSDQRVWLDEKIVTEEEYVLPVYGKTFEKGESYDDFLNIRAQNNAELFDKIVKELYSRGFSPSRCKIIDSGKVHFEYSFLDDSAWLARRRIGVIVWGDITAENDHRRDKDKRGKWMNFKELTWTVGDNLAHKIFENLD